MAIIHSYPMYVSDWVRSETRIKLSSAGRGMFRELLDYCWIEGTLPNDARSLQNISGGTAKEFNSQWPIMQHCFSVDGDRLRHWKVDDKRPELVRFQQQRSFAGSASAEAKRQRAFNERSNGSSSGRSTVVQTDTPVSLQPSVSVSVSVVKTAAAARVRAATFPPMDGPDPQQLVSDAVETVAKHWPNKGNVPNAKRAWEREAAESPNGVAGWCAAVVLAAVVHGPAQVAARKASGAQHYIPTLERWVTDGDYSRPPPKAIRKEIGPIDLGEDFGLGGANG